ncbi:MAG TPA: PAS domain-containing protein [Candidatus Baltobacteraceae bacterium]|nr:PAS domain-containing protein [Candidatus Baltobacteraceae bacterium]
MNATRAFADVVEEIVWIADTDGNNTYVNAAWTAYTGLTLEQSSGFGWQLAIHPTDLDSIQERFYAAAPAGAPFELEARIRSASGEYALYRGAMFPHADAWIGYCHPADVRDYAEDRFRLLADALPMLVWTTDRDDRLTFVNRAWIEYTGLLAGSTLEERNTLVHSDDLEALIHALRADASEVEFRLQRRRDGMYRWHLLRWERTGRANERPFARIGTAVDIHDMRAEREKR